MICGCLRNVDIGRPRTGSTIGGAVATPWSRRRRRIFWFRCTMVAVRSGAPLHNRRWEGAVGNERPRVAPRQLVWRHSELAVGTTTGGVGLCRLPPPTTWTMLFAVMRCRVCVRTRARGRPACAHMWRDGEQRPELLWRLPVPSCAAALRTRRRQNDGRCLAWSIATSTTWRMLSLKQVRTPRMLVSRRSLVVGFSRVGGSARSFGCSCRRQPRCRHPLGGG